MSVLQRPAVNGGLDGHPRAARPSRGGLRRVFVGDVSRSFWGGPMDKTGSHKDGTTVVVLCGSVGHLHSIVTNSRWKGWQQWSSQGPK